MNDNPFGKSSTTVRSPPVSCKNIVIQNVQNVNEPDQHTTPQKLVTAHSTRNAKNSDNMLKGNTATAGAKPKIQTGSDRYIEVVKRKRSPQSATNKPPSKISRGIPEKNQSTNRFDILSTNDDENVVLPIKTQKPPPIYLREPCNNNLIKHITDQIGDKTFHIVPIRKGEISETKICVYDEPNFKKITSDLEQNKKSFYTYQLKSRKGITVVIKGIEPNVDTTEILEALEFQGFSVKSVFNILNKDKIVQPLYRVELEPDNKKLKRNEVHPIYSIRYLLHRKITVEEPRKRTGPVQCTNCQEFGHTKAYCRLPSVCVICGDLHGTSSCTLSKDDTSAKKCSNCGGPHTASYRGCPVYAQLKQRMYSRDRQPTYHTYEQNIFRNPTSDQTPDPNTGFNTKGNASYADMLKNKQTNNNIESMITSLMTTMNQFMLSMQNMFQEMMRNQNELMKVLISKK